MKKNFVLPYVLQATYLGGNEALQQLPTILTSSSHPVSVLTSSSHPVSVCNGQIPSVSFSTSQPSTGKSFIGEIAQIIKNHFFKIHEADQKSKLPLASKNPRPSSGARNFQQ
jgi:hypothetical protein